MIGQGGITVIDIRKNRDYRISHIDGALNMEGGAVNDFINQADKSKPILCYCYKGVSSKAFCGKLEQAGFKNVYSLTGGYDAWTRK